MVSTQLWQKVHSKEQIRASMEWGGSGFLQFSQKGLSSNIVFYPSGSKIRVEVP
jgi:hypothetical protein